MCRRHNIHTLTSGWRRRRRSMCLQGSWCIFVSYSHLLRTSRCLGDSFCRLISPARLSTCRRRNIHTLTSGWRRRRTSTSLQGSWYIFVQLLLWKMYLGDSFCKLMSPTHLNKCQLYTEHNFPYHRKSDPLPLKYTNLEYALFP